MSTLSNPPLGTLTFAGTSMVRVQRSRARTFWMLATVVTLTFVSAACQSTPKPAAPAITVTEDTYAIVNGRQITKADVDKAFQRAQRSSQPLTEEEMLGTRLDVLDELIAEDLLLAKARALKLEIPDKDVDEAFNATKGTMSDQAIEEELKRRNLTTADVREGLRRDLLARKVLQQEVVDKVQVTDAAVTEFFNANRAQFNLPENSYRLAQIVVTPVRDQQPARAGDDASTPQEAQTKAAGLMRRLQEGTPFDQLAREHSEDPQTAPRGGDLGLVPVSSLSKVAPQLRNAIMNAKPGSVTPVNIGGMYTLVLVMGLETAGQRDLSTPQVKESIVANLRTRKEQLLRAAYLTSLRSDADVVNYFARRIVERETKPAAAAATSAGSKPAASQSQGAK
jgi:peptidyl-prolyl cis-trans isomerase SurA